MASGYFRAFSAVTRTVNGKVVWEKRVDVEKKLVDGNWVDVKKPAAPKKVISRVVKKKK